MIPRFITLRGLLSSSLYAFPCKNYYFLATAINR